MPLAVLALGLVALAAFVAVERRSRHPLVPPQLFGDRNFTAANVATLLVYGALGVVFLLLVLQLQVVAGFSPTAAGAALLPVTADHARVLGAGGCARAADRAAAADDGRAAGQRGRVAAAAAVWGRGRAGSLTSCPASSCSGPGWR